MKARQLSLNRAVISSPRQQRRAHHLVARAIRRGDLVRPTICENCGKQHDIIHGHHNDYKRPLAVRWLCAPCHPSAHLALRTQWPDPPWEAFLRRLRTAFFGRTTDAKP